MAGEVVDLEMAGIATEESGVGKSLEGVSRGQNGPSIEALAEWRSSEQLENGIPSTSPPYWDSDDDITGPKPSTLYGKHIWTIDKFSQINKRELRSDVFDVGGHRWYILIYPQGCDVCNHLSLFLCVANHDKLLPGWSHFAQFTIAVVNKDPKKSKYSDTLHRFWKKEHDWGWKKFMERSKVLDGFVDADTLTIKAQVQVIRQKAVRPFRCLDCQYRRELLRVYMTNVEQIYRRFVEERRSELRKLIEDKARWSSFCAFWLEINQDTRDLLSRETTDTILKVLVKHFFIEKEVTSTLVMDSLHSGLRALEDQTKSKECRGKLRDVEELPIPFVYMERDTFVLVDDVLLLLQRASIESLHPKDDKGLQNPNKDGASVEDFSKDSIERDERHLTELGRRTIEIFALAHIFSRKIEMAYQEAVALRRQEELIREEAVWLAEKEQKAKRAAAEKEKSKKKQGKQKRNNCKRKDKGKDDKPCVAIQDKLQYENPADERNDLMSEEAEPVVEKPITLEVASDVFDCVDCIPDMLQCDSEDRDASPVSWDTDASEVNPSTEANSSRASGISIIENGVGDRSSQSVVDDSSSTCSTDSVPSVVINGPYKGSSRLSQKGQKSPSRGKNHRGKETADAAGWANGLQSEPSEATTAASPSNGISGNYKAGSASNSIVFSLQDQVEVTSLGREQSVKDQADMERFSRERGSEVQLSSSSPTILPSVAQVDSELNTVSAHDLVSIGKPSSDSPQGVTEKPSEQQFSIMSRPLSAPVAPGPKQAVISMVQTTQLARSMNAAGQLGSAGFTQPHSPSTVVNSLQPPPEFPNFVSAPKFLSQSPERMEPSLVKSSLSFEMLNYEQLHNDLSPLRDDIHKLDFYKPVRTRSQDMFAADFPACASGCQTQTALADEFPHLDIINDLLDDEHGIGKAAVASNRAHHLNRKFMFPGRVTSSDMGTSTCSCRFERTLSGHGEWFQQGPFDLMHYMIPQANLQSYANEQINGSILNQWHMTGPDMGPLGMGNSMSDAYPYHIPNYHELACSVSGSGYGGFRPSNGQ
ncbi:hypothetical protein NMG60_11032033 [Bertholletia excelsa]